MRNVRAVVALLAAALLAAPTVAAGAAEGRLEAAALALPGASLLETPELAAVFDGEDVPVIEVRAERVTLHRIGQQTTRVSGPVPGISAQGDDIDQAFTATDVVLRFTPGKGADFLAFKAGAASGTLDGVTARPVAGVQYARVQNQGWAVSGDEGCRMTVKGSGVPACLDAAGVHELTATRADLAVGGTLQALLYGPTLEVRDGSGTTTFASGATLAEQTGPVERREDAWIALVAEGVETRIAGAGFTWFAAVPSLEGDTATFEAATGALRVGARDHQARGQDVQATGTLRIALDAVPAGIPPEPASGGYTALAYAGGFTAHVSGDVQTLNLQATPVFTDAPAAATGALAALLAAAGAATYYWPRLAFGAATLYTRLKKPDILDNDVRNRIYDIIREHPGISAREVHRRSDQSWGTVVYHLRQLERHHLVVSRALGRTRNYYENHGKYKGMEAQLACLQSERALALARAIVRRPGITQEVLAHETGFPQPTTSYYVRKLKQAGLVEEQREGRYTRYLPHGDLPRYIAISEKPSVGQSAASGVQA